MLLPQALRHMLPSLGTIIGLSELSFIAGQVNAQVLVQPVAVYGTLAGGYFVMCFGLSRLAHAVERRSSRTRSAPANPTFTRLHAFMRVGLRNSVSALARSARTSQ